MSRRELRLLVTNFRKGILNGKDSDLMCRVVCMPLCGYLSFLGVETKMIEGEFMGQDHAWLEMEDGTIIDPTIDQFEMKQRVYIGPPMIYHKKTEPKECE